MKRFCFLFIVLIFIFVFPVFSQEASLNSSDFDFQRAYQDYTYNLSLYRKAKVNHELSKSQYLCDKTLSLRTKAKEATLEILQSRNEVIKTYLTAQRMKLRESLGLEEVKRELLYSRIDEEVSWLIDHKDRLTSAGSLGDLVNDSDEASERYRMTEPLIYEVLFAISNGKIKNFHQRLTQINQTLKSKIAEIRENEDKQTATLERWILEVENLLARSQDKQSAAEDLIVKIKPRERNKLGLYNQAQVKLKESHQYLKEASGYLKEIVTEIKTAD